MKRLMIVAAAMLAAACQPLPAQDGPPPAGGEVVKDIDTTDVPPPVRVPESAAAECEARGGKMLPQGRMQTLQCVITYADAGRRCTDGDQCQGDCRLADVAAAPRAGAAAVGQCHATNSRFGCYTPVEDGKAGATICVD